MTRSNAARPPNAVKAAQQKQKDVQPSRNAGTTAQEPQNMDLPQWLQDDSTERLQGMLFRNELLPTLMLCRAAKHSQTKWLRDLRRDVARLRSVLLPLQKTRLRLPGLESARQIRVLPRDQDKDSPAAQRLSGDALRQWMICNELGGLRDPNKAMLALNAWPRSTRHIGAALSDFLAAAAAHYDYRCAGPAASPRSKPRLRIHFLYHGIAGTLLPADASRRRDPGQPRRSPRREMQGTHAGTTAAQASCRLLTTPTPIDSAAATSATALGLLGCLENSSPPHPRSMLPRQDLLPLLQTCTAALHSQAAWIRDLRADVSHLRRVLRPATTTRLRLPGFDYPPSIRILARHPTEQEPCEEALGTDHLLYVWMISKRLAGYTMAEAILIMNAWPATSRPVSAALSDFLMETQATAKYTRSTPRGSSPTKAKLIITFSYRSIAGTVLAE